MKIIRLLLIFTIINTYNAYDPNGLFALFKKEHGKVYTDRFEEERRSLIFQANLQKIQEMNAKQAGGPDVEFGINQFADLSQQEFIDRILMKPTKPQKFEESRYLKSLNLEIPDSFDWREKGAVTDVKDQGSAGTCWAFSTTGNIEGVNFLRTGKMTRVSEEQLVDCDGTQDIPLKRADCGVFGGWPYLAFQYIIKAGGIDPEDEYPYCVGGGTYETSCFPCMPPGWTKELCGPPVSYCDEKKWPCRSQRSYNAIKITDWAAISTDENEIAQHLISAGPLSVGLNASMLQFYRKGIYDPWFCNPDDLDHAVLMIGYGVEKNKPYWTIKNSWGVKWGENGYFRIARNKGKCGINKIVATAII